MNWRDRFGPNPNKTTLDEPYRDLRLESLIRLLKYEIKKGTDLDELERKILSMPNDRPAATEKLLQIIEDARKTTL
jgi:hypothetical protein